MSLVSAVLALTAVLFFARPQDSRPSRIGGCVESANFGSTENGGRSIVEDTAKARQRLAIVPKT